MNKTAHALRNHYQTDRRSTRGTITYGVAGVAIGAVGFGVSDEALVNGG